MLTERDLRFYLKTCEEELNRTKDQSVYAKKTYSLNDLLKARINEILYILGDTKDVV
jgi:hypothetical protein